jgi:hypothetical protein
MISKTPEILIPALRQYKHNDNSGEFIAGYDCEAVEQVIINLQMQILDLKAALRSCANSANGALNQYKLNK